MHTCMQWHSDQGERTGFPLVRTRQQSPLGLRICDQQWSADRFPGPAHQWLPCLMTMVWCGVMCDVLCDVIWCCVMWWEEWCDVVCCDEMWCDVMWCDEMWCDEMWCDVMRGVTWCCVLWCDVMKCDVMWWHVMCCEEWLIVYNKKIIKSTRERLDRRQWKK